MKADRQAIKARIPAPIRGTVRDVYAHFRRGYYPHRSWSQTGEDMLLRDLLPSSADGFYVDVGARHPRFGSNTHALHQRGWRGINIDARPGSMRSFRRARPRDVNLEVAVGSVPGEATFYVFTDDELSSLDRGWADAKVAEGHRLERTVTTRVRTLADIHREHDVPARYELLTVDCEGRDADVLASNDWDAFRPRFVVVECSDGDLDAALDSEAVTLLRLNGYTPTAATRLSVVLRDRGEHR